MSLQPSSLPHKQPPQPVQAGLPVRTTIRAGDSNPLENVTDTVQSWWQSLRNALPTGQTATPDQASSQ